MNTDNSKTSVNASGLTDAEVLESRERYGENVLNAICEETKEYELCNGKVIEKNRREIVVVDVVIV